MCHLILLMPVFALAFFWVWPLEVAGPAYAAVTAISLWMYVLIWRAMQKPVLSGAEELMHSNGEVLDVEGDTLHVRVHSEIWNAVADDVLHRGDRVKVIGVSGLILRVTRGDDSNNAV